jgi:hypothetical protein
VTTHPRKRPSRATNTVAYESAIQWLANNDDPAERDIENIRATVTVGLVSDLYGRSVERVAVDVLKARLESDITE